MRYEVNHDGSIVEGERALAHSTNDLLRNLFSQNGWTLLEFEKDKEGWNVEIQNHKSVTPLNFKLKAFVGNVRDESRNPKEKKIQLNGRNPKIELEGRFNIILGIYVRNTHDQLSDIIIVAWEVNESMDYTTNPSIRGVNIDMLQAAKLNGFTRYSYNARGKETKVVCAFRPEFIFFYLENRIELHQGALQFNTITTVNNETEEVEPTQSIQPPANTIYYGAPGTGKSYKVKKLLENVPEAQQERITFHPEYDNVSFVGGYMPITEGEDIKYKFVPQVFTNIYVKAWQNPDKPYYLVIEEINRGNCAEIFGEMFQLLDRTGGYNITPSQSLGLYLKATLGTEHEGIKNGKMTLPPNLQLLATMNTSDQSLFPMDSAFKRRWTWKYIPINEDRTVENNPSAAFVVRLDETQTFNWLDFIIAINDKYIRHNPNLGADKCIGNYFIKPEEQEISLEEFINKAIFYLWVDVFQEEEETPFEDNDSFESFFPEESNGKEKVKLMLKELNVNIDTTPTATT